MLARLPKQFDPNVLVGFDTADDAGVYQLSPELALVQTVDFFTPIVDDPYTFGQIAAANSLSDVYAMGGRPISALSIVGFPNTGRDVEILEKILQGGLAKMQEAGCTVIGGHSIGDEEIKFGYAVTGLINPQRVLKNVGARPGDRLILTKRLGTGVIGTALKKDSAAKAAVDAAILSMCTLNRASMEIALPFEVHAATDVTGFGLLGHAREMAVGSKVSFAIDSAQIEFLPGARELAQEGLSSRWFEAKPGIHRRLRGVCPGRSGRSQEPAFRPPDLRRAPVFCGGERWRRRGQPRAWASRSPKRRAHAAARAADRRGVSAAAGSVAVALRPGWLSPSAAPRRACA